MTTKTPPSMSMKPGIGLPSRKPVQNAEPRSHIEAEKLDPAIFGVANKKSPEQDLLDNAEPIDFSPKPTPARKPAISPPEPAEEKLSEKPKEKELSVYDAMVPDSLLDRLISEYSLNTVRLHEADLEAPGLAKPLFVHVRAMTWDDHNWAIGVMAEKLANHEEASAVSTEGQRLQFYQAAVSCRCLVKIDDQWVWEVFGVTDSIKRLNPNWDGTTHIGIPANIASLIAHNVLDLFRKKLHYNLLYALDEIVKEVSKKEEAGVEEEPSNPTPAA